VETTILKILSSYIKDLITMKSDVLCIIIFVKHTLIKKLNSIEFKMFYFIFKGNTISIILGINIKTA